MPSDNGELHKNHRRRMRNRFLESGFRGFAEHEILEMLLFYVIPRRDTNPLAHKILNEYKTLTNVFEANPQELAKVPGVGENTAVFLTMIPHISGLYEQSRCRRDGSLDNTEALGRYAISMLRGKNSEELALICLDSNRRVHWSGVIASGTMDRLETTPRLIVAEVMKRNAKNVVFVHNHPNGSIVPSITDRETTKNLIDLLSALQVTVIDHIIVSGNRYYSMAETGFIMEE